MLLVKVFYIFESMWGGAGTTDTVKISSSDVLSKKLMKIVRSYDSRSRPCEVFAMAARQRRPAHIVANNCDFAHAEQII